VALLDRRIERVAIDMGERKRGKRAVPHQARRAACGAAFGPQLQIGETVPAKTASRWRRRAHGTSRSHLGSPRISRAALMVVGVSLEGSANAFTVASSRKMKSSTLARNRGSAAD